MQKHLVSHRYKRGEKSILLLKRTRTLWWQGVSAAILLLLSVYSSVPGQSQTQLTSYPPGAVVSFPQPLPIGRGELPALRVLISSEQAPAAVWEAEPLEVIAPVEGEATLSQGAVATSIVTGFAVPQLPPGVYKAKLSASGTSQPPQTVRFHVAPHLFAETGYLSDVPGQVVSVRVRIASPYVLKRGDVAPQLVRVRITLQSANPAVASILSGQRLTRLTGPGGYASWRVLVGGTGEAELTASAPGFEPLTIHVTGESKLGETPEVQAARESLRQSEAKLARLNAATAVAESVVVRQALKDRALTIKTMQHLLLNRPGMSANDALNAALQGPALLAAQEGRDKAEVWVDLSRTDAQKAQAELTAARDRLLMLKPNGLMAKQDLLPGDVLLVRGNTLFFSNKIVQFESSQLGINATYSHAELYVGPLQPGGTPMVGEMWASGFWITPLDVSVRGATLVDVYRWKDRAQLTPELQQRIANSGLRMFGDNYAQFVRSDAPGMLALLGARKAPYAFEQIAVLGAAASSAARDQILQVLSYADSNASGKRKLICSEYVAWAYRDAGLEPQGSRWWSSLAAVGAFATGDAGKDQNRKKDYTTPNMFALSDKFELVGRIWGPAP
jgi:hypothetical protein